MARDLMDDTYYTSKGGKIPVKWTAPEVSYSHRYHYPAKSCPSYSATSYGLIKRPLPVIHSSLVVGCLTSGFEPG